MTTKSPWTRTKPWAFTPVEILSSPSKLKKMLLCDIEVFRKKYLPSGKRWPELRKLIDGRESELLAIAKNWEKERKARVVEQDRQSKHQERVDKLITQIWHIHRYVVRFIEDVGDIYNPTNATDVEVAVRNIGNMIHDLPKVYTGLMSFELWKILQLSPALKKVVFEHFYPRSVVGGRDVLELAFTMITSVGKFAVKDMVNVLYSCSQGNKTTQDENLKSLPPFQKEDTFIDPPTSYHEAGIVLVRTADFVGSPVWQSVADVFGVHLIDPPEFYDVISVEEAKNLLLRDALESM